MISVKRNVDRFPDDFMFRLNKGEKTEVVTNCDHLERLKCPRQALAISSRCSWIASAILYTTETPEAPFLQKLRWQLAPCVRGVLPRSSQSPFYILIPAPDVAQELYSFGLEKGLVRHLGPVVVQSLRASRHVA